MPNLGSVPGAELLVVSATYAWPRPCRVTVGENRTLTLRIEQRVDDRRIVLRLSGRIRLEDLEELTTHISRGPVRALDLEEVTLVDVAAVRFLGACQSDGIELLHCAPYIEAWIGRERRQGR